MSEQNRVETLLGRVALADRAAFSDLYDDTSAKLFGICLRILHDREEAEEALQEAYVKVWRKAGSFTVGRAAAMSWLIAIARNAAIDRLRKRRELTGEDGIETDLRDERPSPEDSALAAGDARRLHACLGELEEDKADLVRSAFFGGRRYQELADMTSKPLGTIKSIIRRSLIALRQCMEREPDQGSPTGKV